MRRLLIILLCLSVLSGCADNQPNKEEMKDLLLEDFKQTYPDFEYSVEPVIASEDCEIYKIHLNNYSGIMTVRDGWAEIAVYSKNTDKVIYVNYVDGDHNYEL